jgi:hypothetical protein
MSDDDWGDPVRASEVHILRGDFVVDGDRCRYLVRWESGEIAIPIALGEARVIEVVASLRPFGITYECAPDAEADMAKIVAAIRQDARVARLH